MRVVTPMFTGEFFLALCFFSFEINVIIASWTELGCKFYGTTSRRLAIPLKFVKTSIK